MGLFSFVGGLIGASKQKKASRAAEAAMIEQLNRAITQNQTNYEQIRGDYAPARDVLAPTVGAMGDIIGINGDPAQQGALDRLKASPMYQSLFRTGEEAVLQNAAATGGIRGGNTQRGLADFGADTFARLIQQQLENLGGLGGVGMNATGATAQAATNNTAALTDLFTNIGNTKAGGTLTRGGITAGMWNNAGSFLDKATGGGGIGNLISKVGKIF